MSCWINQKNINNVVIVGNPTINNGVASGFSSTSYLELPNVFNPGNNNFEIFLKFTTTTITQEQDIFSTTQGTTNATRFGIRILIINSKFRLDTGSSSDSWVILETDYTVLQNTLYYLKVVYNKTNYTVSISTDNINWQNFVLNNSAAPLTMAKTYLGTWAQNNGNWYPFLGSIDLKESYITINGQTWWKGNEGYRRIKDTGAYGIYIAEKNTNAIIYTPKNINIVIENGRLVLKAGSKIYYPDGFNEDGSRKFVEYIVPKDIVSDTGSYTGLYSFNQKNQDLTILTNPISGESLPSSPSSLQGVYDTKNNRIQRWNNAWQDYQYSFPICYATNSGSNITAINKVFDWCGYIGRHQYTFPNVKYVKPDGTVIETDRVILHEFTTYNMDKYIFWENNGSNLAYYSFFHSQPTMPAVSSSGTSIWYNTAEKRYYHAATNGATYNPRDVIDCYVGKCYPTSTNFTSFTPATAQPENTYRPITEVYKGNQLVYQYSSYTPNQIMMNQTVAGTFTSLLKKGVYYIALTGAGGGGSGGYYYNCYQHAGGSGGTITGEFYVKEDTTVTVLIRNGSTYQNNPDHSSLLQVGGVTMMNAGGGQQCHTLGTCTGNVGGSCSFNLTGNLQNVSLKNITGNQGKRADNASVPQTNSNDPIDGNRGAGANTNGCNVITGKAGGVYIQYRRRSI